MVTVLPRLIICGVDAMHDAYRRLGIRYAISILQYLLDDRTYFGVDCKTLRAIFFSAKKGG
jgi:hypothetical protein